MKSIIIDNWTTSGDLLEDNTLYLEFSNPLLKVLPSVYLSGKSRNEVPG